LTYAAAVPSSPRTALVAAPAAAWVATAYFAEGLPYSLVHQVSAQLFVDLGSSLTAVGLTALYGLAWNLKFIWSPFVGRSGSLRAWVLGCQALLFVLALCLVPPVMRRDVAAIAPILALVSFVAATHDVAVDGAYLVNLPAADQPRYAGFRIATYRLALLFGNGLVVYLAGKVGWTPAIVVLAVTLGGLAAHHLIVLPPDRAPLPALHGAGFLRAITSYAERPHAVVCIAFVLAFRAGDALLFAMTAPLFKDLGLETDVRGLLGGIGTAGSIAGSLLGAAIVAKLGIRRVLFPIAAVQAVAIPLYSALAVLRPGFWGICAAVITEQVVAGVGIAALAIFLMRRSDGEEKVAHFAVGSALMSVATTAVGAVSGVLAERVGFSWYFVVAFGAAIPGVFLAREATRRDAV